MSTMKETVLSYAFRPFFLLGAVFAVGIMVYWVVAQHMPAGLSLDMYYWHGHEMLVGFAMTAVAGFLLTAIARWTGRPPVKGSELLLLVVSWLAGRLVMGFAFALPSLLVMSIDMLFPLLLMYFVGREILSGGNPRNFPIVLITGLMALLNFFYHLGRSGDIEGADRISVYLIVHLLLLLVTIISGRIVPNFTAGWLRMQGESRLPISAMPLEILVIVLTLATGLLAAFAPLYPQFDEYLGWVAILAGLAHASRLMFWRGFKTRSNPILFVLHFAYCWFPIGYIATGLSQFGIGLPPTVALHALTMGVIGSMILAVTTRVALGHTGRALQASRAVVVAYCVLSVAIVVRLLGAFSSNYLVSVDISALGWIIAFGIFVWVYWPILIGPRADA